MTRKRPFSLGPEPFGIGSKGVTLGAGGGVLFPQTAAILGAGGLDYAFFDAGLASSLFQDAIGTIPVVATDPVGRWNVRERAPHYASQSIGGSRAVWQADGLKFDAADDYELSDWLAQVGTNCIIAQVTFPAVAGGAFTGIAGSRGSAGTTRFYLGLETNGRLGAAIGSASQITGSPTGSVLGQSLVVGMCADGSNLYVFKDADGLVLTVPYTDNPNPAVPVAIGGLNISNNVSNLFGGAVKRVAFGKTAFTNEQFMQIRAEWFAAP